MKPCIQFQALSMNRTELGHTAKSQNWKRNYLGTMIYNAPTGTAANMVDEPWSGGACGNRRHEASAIKVDPDRAGIAPRRRGRRVASRSRAGPTAGRPAGFNRGAGQGGGPGSPAQKFNEVRPRPGRGPRPGWGAGGSPAIGPGPAVPSRRGGGPTTPG